MNDGPRSRPMDQEFSLDGVKDLNGLFARREEAARSALTLFRGERGVRYGAGEGETLNIFPAGDNAPVMVFIHGGFWRSLDADLFSFLAPGFVPAGVTLVVIDYPLMPAVRMADVVASCGRAVEWTAANAASFGGDPARIFLSGNSAGGHLVAEIMDRPAGAAVVGGTAISGIYDLEPVTHSFQNDSLELTAEEVETFSPLRRGTVINRPLIVAVGAEETPEFLRQSEVFAAKRGTQSTVVPGTNHISILTEALAVPFHPFNTAVLDQIGVSHGGN